MEKSNTELKNLILKFLCEEGSHQLSDGQFKKMIKEPKHTHEIMSYSTHNISHLEKLLEDIRNDGFIEETENTENSRLWQVTTQGLHFKNTDKYNDDISSSDHFTNNEINNIFSTLDELSNQISELQMGQKVTYEDIMDEFEDLKSKIHILDRKNFGQLLKGKLIDLGFGALSGEVMKLILTLFKEHNLLTN